MNGFTRLITSSVGKKYLMAVTGTILSLFVLGHMCGNLQFFLDAHWINSYAHHLQSLPYGLLWVIRAVLLVTVVTHLTVSVVLKLHNAQARPDYEKEGTLKATFASRTLIWTGLVLAAFVVFHILHYTVKTPAVQDFSAIAEYNLEGVGLVPNVQAIMYDGFANVGFSLFYIVAVGCLAFHLSHGVASAFQSVGLRNEVWRKRLECIALGYGLVVFAGFAIIPVSVLLDQYVCSGLICFR
jgi:succinate dehydrogenase / fumarate reductase cytochrome b subunit